MRLRSLANAGCALTCPSKLCYLSISKINKGQGGEFKCSQAIEKRELLGMVDFPLQPYIDLGFHRFNLFRARPSGVTGFCPLAPEQIFFSEKTFDHIRTVVAGNGRLRRGRQ